MKNMKTVESIIQYINFRAQALRDCPDSTHAAFAFQQVNDQVMGVINYHEWKKEINPQEYARLIGEVEKVFGKLMIDLKVP